MSDGKGKGRAKNSDDDTTTTAALQPPQSPSSFLDRVVASAAGLGRSTFAAPGSNELSSHSSGALANSKGQPAGGNDGSTWAEASHRLGDPGAPSQSEQPQLQTFRSRHRDEHVQSTEAEFSSFLDGIDPFTPSNIESGSIPAGEISAAIAREDASSGKHTPQKGYNSVEEQQSHDGEDVSELLSDSRAFLDSSDLSPQHEEVVNWSLTDEQLMVLRGMLDDLFPPGEAHKAPRTDNILNLVPDAASLDGPVGRQAWVDQWDGVLNRYTDEVWGDLFPLVQEAREEVQSMKSDHAGVAAEPPKALRRLGLVLRHLREP